MNKWVVKIDVRQSTDWVTAGSSWFFLSKQKAQEIVEVLGTDHFELVEFEGTETITYYSSYTVTKDNFWVIRSLDNPNVNFYIFKSNSNIQFGTWNFDKNVLGMQAAYISGSYIGYVYIRKASKDTIMFHGQNNAYGAVVIAEGVDQDGNVKKYALSIANGATLYYYCFDTKVYNSCSIIPGLFNTLYADFLGLQKVSIAEWGIIFNDVFFVTLAADQVIKLLEMDGTYYATSAGYISSSSLFQMAIKFPD